MVTYINKVTSWEHPYMEYRGLSTDTKPTDAPVNAKFVELDTGVEYYFSEGTWNIAPSPGGDGSGGGGAEKFVVTLAQDEQTEEWTADKTIAEIFTAYGAEKNVVVHAEQPIDIFCTGAFDMGNMKMVTFGCVTMDGTDPTTYAVLGYENQGTDGWMVNESRLPADGKSYVPAFSPTNNGQVLGVSSGSLAWVAPSGSGAEKFTVTFTESNGNITADKTLTEIVEAKEAGDIVVGVYTSFGLPCEIPCVVAQEMEIEGEALTFAVFAGTVSGESTRIATISGFLDGHSAEWAIDFSEFISSVSYNDLEDKPFYEETVSVAINYTNPYIDGANADKVVEASYLNTSVPISLYRVGDALTAAQLDGATMDLIYNDGTSEGTDSITLTSANITSVQNGRYYMSEGMPYFVVADVDNTTIEIPNCCQFTSLDAGTYLEYIDMGNFFAGAYLIIPSITKDGVTVIHKLDEKFYNGGVSSWNDLTDKPFYEEVMPEINLEMPDGGNYVEASFTVTGAEPMTIPMKLYRAGGVYTPEQLVGATATLDIGEADPESVVINADSFVEIEQDGETVGYVAIGEGLHSIIVLADNTVFKTSLNVPGMTAALTSDNIPTAGTYLVNAIMAEDEFTCISITKAATTEVHKLDSKFYDGGASSWNDLNDRPFYETVTAAGYNFEIDLDDPNYVSGYFDIGEGEDVPAKFYRVGDPLTAAQLLGATGTVNTNGENNSHVIESEYIDEIEDNGDTVGLFVAGDMPYALVINNANTTIDVDATNDRPFGCSGTFASSGTYLCWIDLSTMEEGMSAYNVSLVKEPESTVTPLPDKFYKTPFHVTADLDLANLSVSNVSNSFDEIYAAITSGRVVSLTLQFNDGNYDMAVPMLPSGVVSNDGNGFQITFAVTAPFALSSSTNVYTLRVSIGSNNVVTSNFYLHDATVQ